MRSLALLLASLPLLSLAQPAPPDLRQLPPVAAASAPVDAASAPRRRCVAGCDKVSARITVSEDSANRFEEHRNDRGELVKLFVIPKNGAPRYEVLVGSQRSRELIMRTNPNGEINAQQRDGQAVWRVLEF
jgi:hypothetical protein